MLFGGIRVLMHQKKASILSVFEALESQSTLLENSNQLILLDF